MKRANVNAVRTSHYPNTSDFYYLADKYGFYIQDEVNAETHQNPDLVNNYPEFEPSFLDRFTRMIQRDKNHPSIVMWSTGNEAGLGPAHFEMADYAERVDGTRLLYHQANNGGQAPYSDAVGPRYVSPEALRELATNDEETRPAIMGEYNHAMGNSLGLVHRFWQYINEYDQLQGGFIWDWVNQSLSRTLRTTPDGSGKDNDGTLMNNPDIVPGRDGEDESALALSGLDDWVELYRDPSLDITDPGLTLETVVKPRDPWTGSNAFLTKGSEQYGLHQPDEETLAFFVYNPDEDAAVTATASVPDDWTGSWHHLAGTYDGSTLRLYIDGEECATTEYDGSIGQVPFPVNVGRNAQIHGDSYNGWLSNAVYDRATIYDQALSGAELSMDRSEPGDGAVLWLDFTEYTDEGEFIDYGVSTFCCNGLVFGNRDTQPELSQLKHSHQPAAMTAEDRTTGELTVENEHEFTNLSAYETRWTLSADDGVIQEGALDLDVPPGESSQVTIPFEAPDTDPGVTYWLTVSLRLAEDTWWADAGYEVAFEQFEVPFSTEEPSFVGTGGMPALSVSQNQGQIHVSADGTTFECAFDTDAGTLTSLSQNGKQYIEDGPLLNVWRTPIANERIVWGPAEAEEWRAIGLNRIDHHVEDTTVERVGESVVRVSIHSVASAPGEEAAFETTYVYHILGSGDVLLGVRAVPNDAVRTAITHWLPRVGVEMQTPDRLNRLSWYGNGPNETYPDRKRGAKTDTYEQAVEDQYVPYVRPQDHGNRTEVRWAALSDGDSELAAFGHPEVNVSAHHYDNLDRALYNYQLQELDGVRFNVDHAVTASAEPPSRRCRSIVCSRMAPSSS